MLYNILFLDSTLQTVTLTLFYTCSVSRKTEGHRWHIDWEIRKKVFCLTESYHTNNFFRCAWIQIEYIIFKLWQSIWFYSPFRLKKRHNSLSVTFPFTCCTDVSHTPYPFRALKTLGYKQGIVSLWFNFFQLNVKSIEDFVNNCLTLHVYWIYGYKWLKISLCLWYHSISTKFNWACTKEYIDE